MLGLDRWVGFGLELGLELWFVPLLRNPCNVNVRVSIRLRGSIGIQIRVWARLRLADIRVRLGLGLVLGLRPEPGPRSEILGTDVSISVQTRAKRYL